MLSVTILGSTVGKGCVEVDWKQGRRVDYAQMDSAFAEARSPVLVELWDWVGFRRGQDNMSL